MDKPKKMYRCFICGNGFQIGAGRYDGKYIPRYKINVCRVCYDYNWDGWAPAFEKKLIAHLKKEGIPIPKRNKKEWLPRD